MIQKNKKSKENKACGTWPSPITRALLSKGFTKFSDISHKQGTLFWLQKDPHHNGRTVLMCYDVGAGVKPFFKVAVDIGTTVYGYGGGGYALARDYVAIIQDKGASVFQSAEGTQLERIAEDKDTKFADLTYTGPYDDLFAVREQGRDKPRHSIVKLGAEEPKDGRLMCECADFYRSPCVSRDGSWLAWIEWDHPFMPWDGTRLCLARIYRNAQGALESLGDKIVFSDGLDTQNPTSFMQPQWGYDGHLYVLSDERGYWGIWKCSFEGHEPFFVVDGLEIGQPPWGFGQNSYQLLEDGGCLAVLTQKGEDKVYFQDAQGGRHLFHARTHQCPVPLGKGLFGWIESSQTKLPYVVVGNGAEDSHVTTLQRPVIEGIAAEDISQAKSIYFPIMQAPGLKGQAYFYAPKNAHFCPLNDEKPPMIVQVHGGPTGRVDDDFSLKIQKWTTRGIAVLDVNYGGSTGFGRDWRRRLNGNWGVVDVDDCIDATRYMIATGHIDPLRIAIRGSSSGGMSVFLALAKSPLFAGGFSAYGVTDLCGLSEDTHKFESHYNDTLIGPWPTTRQRYIERSPINVTHDIHVPVMLLHGDADTVVPIKQAHKMVSKLKENKVPYTLKEYPSEGHGFRHGKTREDAFAQELSFYGKIFGFKPSWSGQGESNPPQ